MILVKGDRTNQKKSKVRKFELSDDLEVEDLSLVDDTKIPANTLYKMCSERIEELNKRLEKCRLIARAIECSFSRNMQDLLNDTNSKPWKQGRRKGKLVPIADSDYGIIII